jgi:hypothetical protein
MESANNSNSREDDIIHIEETYSSSDDDAVAVVVRTFDHSGALHCIQRDYLGGHPLFGKEFPLMFRLSRPRFEVMMQDIQQKQIMFYMNDMDRHGNPY